MTDMPMNQADRDDDALARIIRLAGQRPVAPDDVRVRVYAQARAAWEQSLAARRRRNRNIGWLALAATVAAVAVGIALVSGPAVAPGVSVASIDAARGDLWITRAGSLDRRRVAPPASLGAGDALLTAAGGRAALTLAGGVSLRVNENTEIVVHGPDRIDLPSGTIYVDARAPARPVRVKTALGEVSDVGTQFEVAAEAQSLRIRVREGAVQFDDGARALRGAAGDEVSIPVRGEPIRARISPSDPVWNWATELATYEPDGDYSAASLLEWVSRETGRKLQFDDPATKRHAESLRLHGAAGLSPAETLDVVVATTDLRYEMGSEAIIVHVAGR
jgi:ferric-dicitrate binding protein FerR (iron transport regulator)